MQPLNLQKSIQAVIIIYNNSYPYGNNNQNGNYGQQNYSQPPNGEFNGNYNPNGNMPFYMSENLKEKKRLRRLSYTAAGATAGFFLIANIFYPLYYLITGLQENTSESAIISSLSIDLLITMISLAVPFGIAYYLNVKKLKAPRIEIGKATVSAGEEVMIIAAGCALLLLSSYVTNYLTVVLQTVTGVTFKYGFFETPSTAPGFVIFYLRSALMPALLEEFAMRGVVMNSLRRYGDFFALTMSAMVFGLMHGNMVQLPFAILAGYILGYACMKTGTLWTSIAIHFINNAFSVTITALNDKVSENAAGIVSVIGSVIILAVGLICAFILYRKLMFKPLGKNKTFLSGKKCYLTYILSVPMICVLIYMIVQTALMIELP